MMMPTGMMTPMDTAGPGSPGVAVGAVLLPASCRGIQTIESDDIEGIGVDGVRDRLMHSPALVIYQPLMDDW